MTQVISLPGQGFDWDAMVCNMVWVWTGLTQAILCHVDRGDIFLAHRKLHHKFPLSGGIPNVLLSYGKPEEVRAHTRTVIDEVARDGGYILDASAIMQNDTSIENLRAMTETAREHGAYSSSAYSPDEPLKVPCDGAEVSRLKGLEGWPQTRIKPGVCFP